MNVRLGDLRLFMAVARRIVPAAPSVGMGATITSRPLYRLAQTLDAPLFEQIGMERLVTHRGTALFRHAECIEGTALAVVEVKGER